MAESHSWVGWPQALLVVIPRTHLAREVRNSGNVLVESYFILGGIFRWAESGDLLLLRCITYLLLCKNYPRIWEFKIRNVYNLTFSMCQELGSG
jgi:hypothetical protein